MWGEIGQAVGGFVSGIFGKKSSGGSSNSVDWGNILNSGIGALTAAYQNKKAKEAAKEAQKDQYKYNYKLMGNQYQYDTKLLNQSFKYNTALAGTSYDYQNKLQQQQQQYETEMSNTAYTRATADLRNAGINPLLVNGGASTPNTGMGTVSAGSVGTPSVGSSGVSMTDEAQQTANAFSNALEYRNLMIMAKNAQSQEIQAKSQALVNAEIAKTEENKRKNLDSQTVLNEIRKQIDEVEKNNAPEYWKKKLATMGSAIAMNMASAEMNKTGAYRNTVEAEMRKFIGTAEEEKIKEETKNIKGKTFLQGKIKKYQSGSNRGIKLFGMGGDAGENSSYEYFD